MSAAQRIARRWLVARDYEYLGVDERSLSDRIASFWNDVGPMLDAYYGRQKNSGKRTGNSWYWVVTAFQGGTYNIHIHNAGRGRTMVKAQLVATREGPVFGPMKEQVFDSNASLKEIVHASDLLSIASFREHFGTR